MKNIELMREYMRLVEAGEKEPWKHFDARCTKRGITSDWFGMRGDDWFSMASYEFRLKPKTININGFEVPEPERAPTEVKGSYFITDLYDEKLFMHRIWHGDESDILLLKRGVIHKTKEAAIKHAKALLSFTAKGED